MYIFHSLLAITAIASCRSTPRHSHHVRQDGLDQQKPKLPLFTKGIAYSAIRSDGNCKLPSEIEPDLAMLASQNYDLVRMYDIACDQVANSMAARLKHPNWNMRFFYGILDIDNIPSNIAKLVSGVNGNWDKVAAIHIGNELVNSGQKTPAQVSTAISQAKNLLSQAGYHGPVVTVDTWVAIRDNPALCTASDFVAANSYAFFDGNRVASEAGEFMDMTLQVLKDICQTENVMITESGWPSSGGSNGVAIASPIDQSIAVQSLLNSDTPFILFEAFNEAWKAESTGQSIEGFFGIHPDI